MEDVFQILIWLIIIISFLSSFFKKKKKEEQQIPTSTGVDENINAGQKVETQQRTIEERNELESYDNILSEIENLFKRDENLGTKTSEKTKIEEQTEQKNAEDLNRYQQPASKQKTTISENTPPTEWEKQRRKLERKKSKIDSSIENQAKKIEALLNEKTEPIGDILIQTVKEKLEQPETLKDYILMSEIIGRPKARRR